MTNPHRRANVVCRYPGQLCKITAKATIFLHSTYDMKLVDLLTTLDNKSSHIAYMAFIFVPDIMLYDEGMIPDTPICWSKKKMDSCISCLALRMMLLGAILMYMMIT